jgi:hypothetical protein
MSKRRFRSREMNTNESEDDRRLPDNYSQLKAAKIWELAERTLNDEILLSELGFPDRGDVEKVVVLIAAGDRLHPKKGFDFVGPSWRYLDKAECNRLLDERERATKKIVDQVEHALKSRGYEAAQELAKTTSPFQVVFLADSEPATQAVVQHLMSLGLGERELSDCDFGKRGNFLYFHWEENLSYFLAGDYPLPGEIL